MGDREPKMLEPYMEKETRWNKIRYISKFMTHEATVTLKEITWGWALWDAEERWDFMSAFICKKPLTDEDMRIIDFIMRDENPHGTGLLPFILTNFPDRDKALEFVTEQIQKTRLEETGTRTALLSHFYKALGTFGNSETIPMLKEKISELLDFDGLYERGGDSNFAAKACLAALKTLDKFEPKDEYKKLIEGFKLHPNIEVAYQAEVYGGAFE